MRQVNAFAPATIANFNEGYDVLGVSLNNIGDEVKLIINDTNLNKIIEIKNGETLPKSIDKNCCSVVINEMQKDQDSFVGVEITIVKVFASGSGLGSSSASSAAAAYAYNALIGKPYSTKELVHFAALGEKVACGIAHIDNVSPSFLDGIILATGTNIDKIIELPVIDNLYAVTFFLILKSILQIQERF
jgi:homoserine kinase